MFLVLVLKELVVSEEAFGSNAVTSLNRAKVLWGCRRMTVLHVAFQVVRPSRGGLASGI